MTFVSYAQNFEDVMLWRALKHVENGVYIDIGAQHPVIDSVSLAFYEHGWRGVHVEPNSNYAQLLRANRPDETVIQAAVCARAGILKFFEIADTGLSTGDAQIAEQHRSAGFAVREVNVPCVTLDSIFESCDDREFHWLKIDAEGLEQQVLQGWKPSKVRPWVVVVESTVPSTQVESHDKWENLILDLDYQFVYFDGLNRYYLSKAHLELKDMFRASPNVFDEFVLSGTSSASFCFLLNNRLVSSEQELGAQVAQGQVEVQRLTQTLATREQEISAQVSQGQEEVRCLTQTHATREQELGAQVVQGQNELAGSLARGQWLENELNIAKIKIDELNQHSHHWWMAAESLNRQLQAVYASHSWRLTLPLRATSSLIMKSKRKIIAGVFMIISAPRLARFTLRHALAYVNKHPKIKMSAIKLLARFPLLKAHIKAFSQSNIIMSKPRVSFKKPQNSMKIVSKAVTQAESEAETVTPNSLGTDIQLNLHRAVTGWRLGRRVDE